MFRTDPNYRTKTVPRWSRTGLGGIIGCSLCSMGILAIIFEVSLLFTGRVTEGGSLGSNLATPGYEPLTWTESPFWPAAGKGFWVGLLLIATGVVGLISWRDGTRATLKAFSLMAALSCIFSFYMMITAIIPVWYYNCQNFTDTFEERQNYQSDEYVFNSLLIGLGTVATIVSFLATIVALATAGYCTNGRARMNAGPRGRPMPFRPGPYMGGRPGMMRPPMYR